MKSKIVKKTLTSSIQSPSVTVLTLGLLPIMSAWQLIRAPRHGSTRDYCYNLKFLNETIDKYSFSRISIILSVCFLGEMYEFLALPQGF